MHPSILYICFFSFFGILSCSKKKPIITLYIQNSEIAVRKLEDTKSVSGDCNFLIQLHNNKFGNWKTVFSSADEKPVSYGEKFKVSGKNFMLYGDRFHITQSAEMILNGESIKAYLLIDTESGQVWCNSSQLNLPRFTKDELKIRGF